MLRLSIILFLVFATSDLWANETDSVKTDCSLIFLPYISYQPETNWTGGISGGFYLKSNNQARISSITSDVNYTLLNQFSFNLIPKLYFGQNKWYLYAGLNIRKYPDYFYGIGSQPSTVKLPFTSNLVNINFQPQYIASNQFRIGINLGYRNETTIVDSKYQDLLNFTISKYGDAGWKPYKRTHLGLILAFDNRDNQYYPQNGIFGKLSITPSVAGWSSDFTMTDISIDFRNFVPVAKNHIFAWQVIYTSAISKTPIPFQLLPTLGGMDWMRGLKQNVFRNNTLAMLQTEYRVPLIARLKAALFMSAGEVFDYNKLAINKIKFVYGVGLRYKLNQARVHLRLDLARNNIDNKFHFYITTSEAF